METVADLIRALGGRAEAAKQFKVHRTRVFRWEQENRIPARHTFKAAELLGVPSDSLKGLIERRAA